MPPAPPEPPEPPDDDDDDAPPAPPVEGHWQGSYSPASLQICTPPAGSPAQPQLCCVPGTQLGTPPSCGAPPVPVSSLPSQAVGKTAIIDHKPQQPGDVERTYADLARSRAELGYEPKVSLSEGLARFVAWFREQQV